MTAGARRDWVRTWSAAPEAADAALGSLTGDPPLADVTLRQVVRISGGGHRVRVRVTNEYGTAPLTIGAARVGLAAPGTGGGVVPGTHRELRFAGRAGTTVPAGAACLSDPVDLTAPDLARLSISLCVPTAVGRATVHDPALDTGWVIPGDALDAPAPPPDAGPLPVRALISGVDVRTDAAVRAVVVLGDSRADGIGSTPDAHRSWPELLGERLLRRGEAVHVVNQGLSGNRLLHDGIGASGLARFDRDVLATPGLGEVIVALGGNDLAVSVAPRAEDGPLAELLAAMPGGPVTPTDVIAGLRQLVARARECGVRVHGVTIPPSEGDESYTPAGDRAREVVNDWIRTGGAFDTVLDLDAVWRDPTRPSRIRDGFHAGDHLHGSDEGHQAFADAVATSLVARSGRTTPCTTS